MGKLTGLAKLEETVRGWETNAPDDKFFDLTLTQFKAQVQLSRDAEAEYLQKDEEREAAKNKFKDINKQNIKLEQNIAKAIAGDPRYGDDSTLYESTGRVRKSERQTGLTRKKKDKTKPE